MQLIRLNSRHLLYLGATLVLLGLLVAVALEKPLYQLWLERWVAPRLQQEFGFTAGFRTVTLESGDTPAFTLLTVTPGGRLYKAGFRAGDIPVGYQHGFVSGFYNDLLAVDEGQEVEIAVIPAGVPPGTSPWKRLLVSP